MIEFFNVPDLIAKRASQSSFHIASERHVRLEFRNMARDEQLERFAYAGDVVVTCYKGEFSVASDEGEARLVELCVAVIPADTWTTIRCVAAGTIQILWAPAHAETRKA